MGEGEEVGEVEVEEVGEVKVEVEEVGEVKVKEVGEVERLGEVELIFINNIDLTLIMIWYDLLMNINYILYVTHMIL